MKPAAFKDSLAEVLISTVLEKGEFTPKLQIEPISAERRSAMGDCPDKLAALSSWE
jgi:hypothetical protein